MWFAALLIPAIVILAMHLLLLGLVELVAYRRIRRQATIALGRGDEQSLTRAAAQTAEALRDWPSRALWEVGVALEIVRCRAEGAA